MADRALPAADFQLPTSNFQLPTSNFQLLTSNFQLPTSERLIIPPRVHPCAHAHYAIKQYLVNDNASYSHYCVFADPGLQWLRCCCSAISSFVQWAYSRTACSSVFPCRLQLQANSHVSVYCSYTESCCLLNSSGEC